MGWVIIAVQLGRSVIPQGLHCNWAMFLITTAGTLFAIRELEKTIPGAGFTLMSVFFPAVARIDRERYRDEKEARFWEWMLERPKSEQRHCQGVPIQQGFGMPAAAATEIRPASRPPDSTSSIEK
ncbi:hypothetical protein TWF696_007698 [Orbilia brochopaga]|uniref:Uncharacterized protein n=1 Tax=Orbilia brochopaga TaxID=3140254 RepID=A0AAV9UKX5_9PEZI